MRSLGRTTDGGKSSIVAKDSRLRQRMPGIGSGKKRPELTLVHSHPGIKPEDGEVLADLTITVSNIQASRGQIMLAIYDSRVNFNCQMRYADKVQARKGEVTFRFPDLATGEYAVMVFHDLNNNGKLETNMFGMPTEPWGASMREKPAFRAPTWSDVCFNLPKGGLSLGISLQQ